MVRIIDTLLKYKYEIDAVDRYRYVARAARNLGGLSWAAGWQTERGRDL